MNASPMTEQHFEYVLRLADSDLVLGQRLAQWCGQGPTLEEDIALTNVALDLIGQAQLWLDLAAEIETAGRDADALAYLREAHEYKNLILVEQPNRDFAQTLVRQFFFDVWHYLVLAELINCKESRIAEIAEKSIKEVRYHLKRSGDWVVRLGDGTQESHQRSQAAVDGLWDFVGEIFEANDTEKKLVQKGIAADVAKLRQPWLDTITTTLEEATLSVPEQPWARAGIKRGQHTEHLSYLLAEMQSLHRAHPEASW